MPVPVASLTCPICGDEVTIKGDATRIRCRRCSASGVKTVLRGRRCNACRSPQLITTSGRTTCASCGRSLNPFFAADVPLVELGRAPTDPQKGPRLKVAGGVEFLDDQSYAKTSGKGWRAALVFFAAAIWSIVASGAHLWLGVAAALILLEFGLAVSRGSMLGGFIVFDEAVALRVAPLLTRLCERVACDVPRVAIRTASLRLAFVARGRENRVGLVLALPLLAVLDDAELDAVLAHEVAHIAGGDLQRRRRQAAVVRIAALVLYAVVAVAVLRDPRTDPFSWLPLLFACLILFLFLAGVLIARINRPCELRADAEGARLSGKPEALASALSKIQALSAETRRKVFGRFPWKYLLLPLSWRMPSHPPLAQRVARLRQLSPGGSEAVTAP